MKQVDARGQLCPVPVLMVQNEVKASNTAELEVLVDDKCAVENVSRFAKNQGYTIAVVANDDEWTLKLSK